jgi:hypothetical protein
VPDGTSKDWDLWNRRKKVAQPGETVGMTRADVQRGLELDEAEERGRRQGYVQGGQDALDVVRNASLLDRMRGGDRLEAVVKDGMREREVRRRRQLPPSER